MNIHQENGFKEGDNVKYDVQNAQGDPNNSQTIAKNLVGDGVDLIFANSTPSAVVRAARIPPCSRDFQANRTRSGVKKACK